MRNKQKAWRLGAMVIGQPGRVVKEHATLLGAAFREQPGLQRRVQEKRLVTRGKRLDLPGAA